MAFKYTMGAKAIRELFSEIAVVDERKAQVLYEEVHDLWVQTKTIITICREMKNYIERDAEQLRSRLPRLTTKVTIVFGENDSFAKVEDMVATDAVLPNSELLILAGVGHFVHYLYPERVAEIILRCAASTETPSTPNRL